MWASATSSRGRGAHATQPRLDVADAATAEISRSQIWQWVHNDVTLSDTGEQVTPELVRKYADEETDKIRQELGADVYDSGRFKEARDIFEQVSLADDFATFLTLPAYDLLD